MFHELQSSPAPYRWYWSRCYGGYLAFQIRSQIWIFLDADVIFGLSSLCERVYISCGVCIFFLCFILLRESAFYPMRCSVVNVFAFRCCLVGLFCCTCLSFYDYSFLLSLWFFSFLLYYVVLWELHSCVVCSIMLGSYCLK